MQPNFGQADPANIKSWREMRDTLDEKFNTKKDAHRYMVQMLVSNLHF
jgi:hypothetical protein